MFAKWAKRWMIILFALPMVAWLLDQAAHTVERRKGRSDLTRGLHGVAERMRRFRRRR